MSELLNLIPDDLIYVMIRAIRENSKELLDRGITYDIKNDGFYVDGTLIYDKEAVRVAWSGMSMIRKLKAEALPIPFSPPSDIIILRPIDSEAFHKSKLLIPDTANKVKQSLPDFYKEMPLQGIVVAVGPGFMTDSGNIRPVGCEVGDHVLLRVGSGLISDFLFMGGFYYWTRSSELLGVCPVEYGEYLNSYSLKFSKP